ncbi:MAG: NAD(P)-binding protein [Acidobacteria bacterium]|nr:NAD(P)-binding protein [Acidobacteriota bacterium]
MTPGTADSIAILGAGPTGLEAALAAAERGLAFTLYEAADGVAGHVLDWSHVELFSPWAYDISPRARRALSAAGVELPDPSDPSCPSGKELVERVLGPLGELAQISPHLRTGVNVVSVGRQGLLKHEEIASDARRAQPFRLLLRDSSGHEWVENAGAVLDCTGSYSQPNALGDGGIPAPGETSLADEIRRRIPDLDSERAEWVGRTILVVGAGHSALTAVSGLAELAASSPGTSVVWALRREHPGWHVDPNDPLPGRSRLAKRAHALLAGGSAAVIPITGVVVDSVSRNGNRFAVGLRRTDGVIETVHIDKILSLTGSVGDHNLYRQLQIHECYATLGPMKLAAALPASTVSTRSDESSSADCLDQKSLGAETLVNPEPGFFILGAKSYGRNSSFLMRLGWEQVDDIFDLLDAPGSVPATEPVAN